MFAEDIETLLVGAGLIGGAYIGADAVIPDSEGPHVSIIETAGVGVEFVQDVAGASMEMPGAQIVVRAADYVTARTLAKRLHDELILVRNRTIGGVWYRQIRVLQLPFGIGRDATGGRARVAFNVVGDKKPS
jgi:hypothetical protein